MKAWMEVKKIVFLRQSHCIILVIHSLKVLSSEKDTKRQIFKPYKI